MPRNQERIAADYQRMWDTSHEALRRGDIEPDTVPVEAGKRWGVSVVLRPAGSTAARLIQTAQELKAFAGDSQIIYDLSNLHTTIRTIEFYRLHIPENDPKVAAYEDILTGLTRRFWGIRMAYRGLTTNRTGVMAQGWPQDDALQDFRDAFHTQLDQRGLLTGPEAISTRQTAHASLAVFTHPLTDPEGLVNYVQNHRETAYGTVEAHTIELVHYSLTPTAVNLTCLASFPLNE